MADSEPHRASLVVPALPETVYEAFVNPGRLAAWLPPRGARGRITAFEPWPGGRFELTLTFADVPGKSSANEDVVECRFVDLAPPHRVVLAVSFRSDDPAYAGTMRMTWNFLADPPGTRVSVVAQDVPRGIDRAQHEAGMRSTLENLRDHLSARR